MWAFRTRSVGCLALLLGGAVLVMSADARASTVFAAVHESEEEGPLGPVEFVAGPGGEDPPRGAPAAARARRAGGVGGGAGGRTPGGGCGGGRGAGRGRSFPTRGVPPGGRGPKAGGWPATPRYVPPRTTVPRSCLAMATTVRGW